MKERREYLHQLELPVAQLCAMTANLNRDPKKTKRPYTTEDFTFFHDEDSSKPEHLAAVAYMTLVEKKRLPSWALFCLNDFKHGKGKTYSTDPALIGDGLVLLAPSETDAGLKGVMLAEHKNSGKQVTATWEGHQMLVSVPKFEGFVVAQADVTLKVLREMAPGTVA